MRSNVCWISERQKFDEAAGKLEDVIFGPPCRRMPIARSDGKAQPLIERSRGLEIAHGVNDVVKAARLRIHSLSYRLVEAGMTMRWVIEGQRAHSV